MTSKLERAVLAGGCFWGMQDLIRKLPGVVTTRVGYTGGNVPNATYRNHGSHAEAIEIEFDPNRISYRDLLEFFFQIHDPTTLNRQGNDVGTSYRSEVFYVSEAQHDEALQIIDDANASGLWPDRVVTKVSPANEFWEAEPEHQDYLERYPLAIPATSPALAGNCPGAPVRPPETAAQVIGCRGARELNCTRERLTVSNNLGDHAPVRRARAKRPRVQRTSRISGASEWRATMQVGMIGLGRMGANMVRRLLKGGHECVVFDRSPDKVQELTKEGAVGACSLAELVSKLEKPRAVWPSRVARSCGSTTSAARLSNGSRRASKRRTGRGSPVIGSERMRSDCS